MPFGWLLACCLYVAVSGLYAQDGMVLISAKDVTFQMGSEMEAPVHAVTFTRNFWMDTTEVTQRAYQTLMHRTYAKYSDLDWVSPYGVGDNYPAYLLEWADAALYCNARSKAEGRDTVYVYTRISGHPGNGGALENLTIQFTADGYRLPTEAEWEFACRAGTTTDFFWNKNFDPYPETSADTSEMSQNAVWLANSWNLSADDSNFGTHPVAAKQPNALGLYDMSGNVSEWVNDWYEDYSSDPVTDPVTDPTGSESETYRFVRGGNWGNTAYYLRASCREFASPDYYIYFIGFRTVLPVDASSVGATDPNPALPATFALTQNYPNPFNPTTTIQFELPETVSVSLTIFNVNGQVVGELLNNQIIESGQHAVLFNASALSAGIYFYQLTAGDFKQVKRMVLIK
jgi:formylglycine-generating enzyme required for sulfatase activity